MLIKNNIHFSIIDKLTVDVENSFECITVKFMLEQNITVSSIYRQPNCRITYITSSIDYLFKMQKGNFYLCGDFNINLLDYI